MVEDSCGGVGVVGGNGGLNREDAPVEPDPRGFSEAGEAVEESGGGDSVPDGASVLVIKYLR
jgi:hypothetical protein